MAGNSTLDPDNFPPQGKPGTLKGHDTAALGPSDSSDSGSDLAAPGTDALIGDLGMDAATDRFGTGEHLTAGKEPDVRVNGDRGVDRIVGEEEAGLGDGLDQAEEAATGQTRYGRKPQKPER